MRDMLNKKLRLHNCTSTVVTIMQIYVCMYIFMHVYTPTPCSETAKGDPKSTQLLKSGKNMDDFFSLNLSPSKTKQKTPSPSILLYCHYNKKMWLKKVA